MKLPNFSIIFSYGEEKAPYTQDENDPKMLPTTTCIIFDNEGDKVAEATVIPFHNSVNNRVYARKCAFEKAVTKIDVREIRKHIWNIYRKDFRQPDRKRIRIRSIEQLIKHFPGVSSKDYETLSNKLRSVLMTAKKFKAMEPEEVVQKKVTAPIPNEEPMAEAV